LSVLFAALEGSTSRPSGYCARAVGGHALINNTDHPPSAICKTKAATVFIAPPRFAHDVGFQRYRKKAPDNTGALVLGSTRKNQ